MSIRRFAPWALPIHPFDRAHGTETGGVLGARKLRSGHPHDAQSTAYFGSQPSIVRAGLQRWLAELQVLGLDPSEFFFVDIGCGKGRVLMLASEIPFRQVLGLELSPKLVLAAQANLLRWASGPHPCGDISVLQGDVLDFTLPAAPVLLFMYHPFEQELFLKWLGKLEADLAHRMAPVFLLYANPYFEQKLLRSPFACLLWSEDVSFSAGEIAAHRFGGTRERISLYRFGESAGPSLGN